MTDTVRDNNQTPAITALLNSDGSTIVRIKVNPTTHITQISDGTTGSDLTGDNAPRDNNGIPVMMGVSSADGATPVPIYADTNGNLLIDST